MGSDINSQELLKIQDNILDNMINRIKSWDKSPEIAMEIIEKNEVDIDKLQSIEKSLKEKNISYGHRAYLDKVTFILEEERIILSTLSKRKDEVGDIINQLSKKDKIKNNYIKQNKNSIFIDQDF